MVVAHLCLILKVFAKFKYDFLKAPVMHVIYLQNFL